MLTPKIPIEPIPIPSPITNGEIGAITPIVKDIPVPITSAEMIPKVYVNIRAGFFAFASNLLKALTLPGCLGAYSFAICSA